MPPLYRFVQDGRSTRAADARDALEVQPGARPGCRSLCLALQPKARPAPTLCNDGPSSFRAVKMPAFFCNACGPLPHTGVKRLPFAPSVALITGGGSGIGAGLAAALHARGTRVVIAGRTPAKLKAFAARHPGTETEVVDVADSAQIYDMARRVEARHPGLDALINNAGVQTLLDFSRAGPVDPESISREVNINLSGLIHVTNAFLPLLKRRSSSRLVHVGSGLGYVPLAAAPVYSATKAAVHSFTVSLRRQLAGSSVQVIEILPPQVDTDLHRNLSQAPPMLMKRDAFVAATLAALDAGHDEIAVGLARPLRWGSRVAPGLFLRLVNQGGGQGG